MRKHRRSLSRNLSPHGICALAVFLFSQVFPLVSLSSVQPLIDRLYQRGSTVIAVEPVGIALFERTGFDSDKARGSRRVNTIAARSKPAAP